MKNKYLFQFFPYPGIETVCWENWDFERQQLTLPDGRKVCWTIYKQLLCDIVIASSVNVSSTRRTWPTVFFRRSR